MDCTQNGKESLFLNKRNIYKGCLHKFTMVDTMIRIDDELIKFIEGKKLIPRESYKSVLKRLLKIKNGKRI